MLKSKKLRHVRPLAATSSWIQVNLGQTRKVTGIVIQGCPQNDHWITKFKIQHSMDGRTWTDHTADGGVSKPHHKKNNVKGHTDLHVFPYFQIFPGSADRNTPDTQLLGTPVSAQFVRILPLEFNVQTGLRFDVLGCTPDCKRQLLCLIILLFFCSLTPSSALTDAITCADKPNFNFANDKMT